MVALDRICLCCRKILLGISTAGKKEKKSMSERSPETVNEERKQVSPSSSKVKINIL